MLQSCCLKQPWTATDHVSTSHRYPLSLSPGTSLSTTGTQRWPMKSPMRSGIASSGDVIFWVISATNCSCCMQYLGREWVFPPVMFLSSEIEAGIGVLIADAVVTGKVNCYSCIVQLCTVPSFTETSSRGM